MANNHTFKVGDAVKTKAGVANQYAGGKIKYVACGNARPSVGTCARNTCAHDPKDYIWVLWPGKTTTVSYPYSDIELDPNAAQQASPANQSIFTTGVAPQAPRGTPEVKEETLPIETVVDKFKEMVKDKEVIDATEFDWRNYNSRPITDSRGKPKSAKF